MMKTHCCDTIKEKYMHHSDCRPDGGLTSRYFRVLAAGFACFFSQPNDKQCARVGPQAILKNITASILIHFFSTEQTQRSKQDNSTHKGFLWLGKWSRQPVVTK